MSVIVNIRFESDLSEFNSTVTDGGDLYWDNSATAKAVAGTQGAMACLIDDTTAIYGLTAQLTQAAQVRFRFYIDPNSLTMANEDSFVICYVSQKGGLYDQICQLYLAYTTATGYYLIWSTRGDTVSTVGYDTCTITDAPHYIECLVVRAATDVSSDGSMQWWVDGVDQGTTGSIDNYNQMSDQPWRFHFGAYASVDAGTSGTFFIDEIVVNNDGGVIGPAGAPTQNYTRGDYLVLPTNDDDLETAYSASDYTDVSSHNETYVDQTGQLQHMIHEFKDYVGSEPNCRLTAILQTDLDTALSHLYLDIYNYHDSEWNNLAEENDVGADTDITFDVIVSDLSNFKDGSDMMCCRIRQEAI